MKKHSKYYLANKKYSDFLESQSDETFDKYIHTITKYLKRGKKFLDVGCGTGKVLERIDKKKYQAYGIEISNPSVEICKSKKLQCEFYDGETIPFPNATFDVVGSINVLEHTEHPIHFLDENYRVLKKDGYIILSTPNFLSITNNFHIHTRGVAQKMRNIVSLAKLVISSKVVFEKMEPINNEIFSPDDDAVNITNPVSILKWAKHRKMEVLYWSSQYTYRQGIFAILDKTPFKVFLGCTFIVLKKS